MPRSSKTGKGGTGPLSRSDGKTYCLDTGKTNAIEILEIYPKLQKADGKSNLLFHRKGFHNNTQVFGIDGKVNALDTAQGGGRQKHVLTSRIRRLTPRECGRLQTVPEHIIDKILNSGVSESQIYKMFGNGWTIEAIVHFLKYLK